MINFAAKLRKSRLSFSLINSKVERLWNRNYCLAMAASTMTYLSFYLLMPLLPLYLTDCHDATKETVGMVLAGFSIAALLSRPMSGYITDTFDRKKVMMLFIGVFAAVYVGYFIAGTLLAFAIVRTLHGAPYGAMTVANSTMAIDVVSSSRRGEGIGYYGLSTNVGMALGPSMGLFLYHWTKSFEILFGVAIGLALLGLVFASNIKHPQSHKRTMRKAEGKKPLSFDRFFLTRAWLLAINVGIYGFCFGALSNYIAIFTRERYGMEDATGSYFALLALGLISARLLGARGLSHGHVARNAGGGALVALIGYVLFVSVDNVWAYYASALLIGFGNGHMYPAFLTMFVNMAHHNERGTANSTILTGWDVGFGSGVLVCGSVAERLGTTEAFLVVAGVEAVGVALYYLRGKHFYESRMTSRTDGIRKHGESIGQ
ncbi:MAG: MFS transporter [Paludibacteraceae bacterium]|nr:MFS transporter [Paludibacteraceae bacterium]